MAALLLAAGAAAGVAPARAAIAAGPGAAGRAAAVPVSGILNGVAAVSARDAWAVGTADPLGTLIGHWNGAAWRRVPSPAAKHGRLFAVAAVSTRDAWAVGTDLGRALIVHWNGAAWHRVRAPSPSGDTILQGVAAVSARDVWAVGTTGILHWNGSAWRQVRAPGGTGAGLTAVTATSARNAWAVGAVGILRWNGTAWTRVRHPGFARGSLYGVTATSAANAWGLSDFRCAGFSGFLTYPLMKGSCRTPLFLARIELSAVPLSPPVHSGYHFPSPECFFSGACRGRFPRGLRPFHSDAGM